jgi:hypothetical protein
MLTHTGSSLSSVQHMKEKKWLSTTFTDNHNSATNTSSVHASTAEIWLPLQGHMGVLCILFFVMDSTSGSKMFAAASDQMLCNSEHVQWCPVLIKENLYAKNL